MSVLSFVLAVSLSAGGAIEEFMPEAEPVPPRIPELDSRSGPEHEFRPFARLSARWGVDTGQEPDTGPLSENVSALWLRGAVGMDVRWSSSLRFYGEGRVLWRGSVRSGWGHPKAQETWDVGELFVDIYTRWVDIRIGKQVFAFGANAFGAPTDVLNPRDFRDLSLFADIEDVKLPVFGIRALVDVASFQITAAYVPFFQPSRFDVIHHDGALLQPGLGLPIPIELDPSIEDLVAPRFLETRRPQAFPWLGDVGVRVTRRTGDWTLGLSWVWFYEKLPEVALNGALQSTLERLFKGMLPNPTELAILRTQFLLGQPFYSGVYQRQHTVAAEASVLLGQVQVDADVAFSPEQTWVDQSFRPTRNATVSWVLGIAPATQSEWLYGVTYTGYAVGELRPGQALLLVEPRRAAVGTRTAWLHLMAGVVGRRFLEGRLELSVRATGELTQRSWSVAPSIAYAWTPTLSTWLGVEVQGGPGLSLFGYWGRNDQAVLGVSWRI